VKPRRTAPARSASFKRALLYAALGVAAAAALSGSGCATGVNTLPDDEPNAAGGSSAGKGGSAGGGGSTATAGTGSAGKGGTASQAFGGAAATGGAGGKGGSAGAGGSATGGSAGAGGGAAAGSSSGGSGSGSGGTGGGAAGSGGSGVATGCLKDWQDNEACDTCTTQTQGDKLGCVDILDCYAVNDCGPSTCANNDDKCGVNKIAKGTAGYEIAADVYDCICQ
jgi:hypothetical protein